MEDSGINENVSPSSRVLAELVEIFEVGSSSQEPRTGTARVPVELVRASHDVLADLEHREARDCLPVLARLLQGFARSTYDVCTILRTPCGELAMSARGPQGVTFAVRAP